MKTKKQKLALLKDIHQLHQNLRGMLQPAEFRGETYYTTGFLVNGNEDLLLQISSLLEVCVFALDGNGIMLSPTNQSATKQDSVCRVLEMVLNLLPDAQMCYQDRIMEKLSALENDKNKD